MAESNRPQEDMGNQEEKIPYTPASPVKRTLAWIGLAYMAIVVALTTYFYFTASMLNNLAPLLSIPGLVGAGAVMIVRWRTQGGNKFVAIAVAGICWLLAALSLPLGIVGLMSNF